VTTFRTLTTYEEMLPMPCAESCASFVKGSTILPQPKKKLPMIAKIQIPNLNNWLLIKADIFLLKNDNLLMIWNIRCKYLHDLYSILNVYSHDHLISTG
jgi:hypothetical protein